MERLTELNLFILEKTKIRFHCCLHVPNGKEKAQPDISWRCTVKGQEATDSSCNNGNSNEMLRNNLIVEIVKQGKRSPEELWTPDPSFEAQLDQAPSNLICSEWEVGPVASRSFSL